MCVAVQENNERIRDLNNQLEFSKRKRTELEHQLHDVQNQYIALETTHRRSGEKESVLQQQISDLQSQIKDHLDSQNQTKVIVNDLRIKLEDIEKVRAL